jgi:hypothetical protein
VTNVESRVEKLLLVLAGMRVPKKSKAKQEKARIEIPAGAATYASATAEEVDGVRQASGFRHHHFLLALIARPPH